MVPQFLEDSWSTHSHQALRSFTLPLKCQKSMVTSLTLSLAETESSVSPFLLMGPMESGAFLNWTSCWPSALTKSQSSPVIMAPYFPKVRHPTLA